MGYRDAMKRGLAGVANLSRFLGLLESYSRRVGGGGSISRRLFQNEALTDVHVEGSRRRVRRGGSISRRLFQNEALTDVHVEGSARGAHACTDPHRVTMWSSSVRRESGSSS